MPRHPVELGPRTFSSKTAAKAYISQEILHRYPVGQPITDPEHIAVLMDVLRRKDNAEEKIGSGIDYFYVDSTSNYRGYVGSDALTLVIHHTSPREEDVDFGYSRVIDDSTDIDYAKEALRYAIADMRDDFKFMHFTNGNQPYDQYGDLIASHEDAEVRYGDPDWGRLTADFADTVGGWSAIETHSGDGVEAQIGRRLISSEIEKQWRDYYAANADPILVRKPGR